MKALILLSLLSIPTFQLNNNLSTTKESLTAEVKVNLQPEPAYGRMSAIEFKSQDYCRAELKDFEFDARFIVVSATVYFSGANFRGVEKAVITSNSLKSISSLKGRCIPGSIVVFDDVKVKGPDNVIRTIPGVSYMLY